MNPYTYHQLIFDKGAKILQTKEEQSFQQMVLPPLFTHMCENKTGPFTQSLHRD